MPDNGLTPAERRMRSQLGAHALWAKTEDRAARTQAARSGFYKRFENEVDPDGVLDPAERVKRAEHARQAHMIKMAMASAKARRLRAQLADIEADLADEDQDVVAAALQIADGEIDGGAVVNATHPNTDQRDRDHLDDHDLVDPDRRIGTGPHAVHIDEAVAQ